MLQNVFLLVHFSFHIFAEGHVDFTNYFKFRIFTYILFIILIYLYFSQFVIIILRKNNTFQYIFEFSKLLIN